MADDLDAQKKALLAVIAQQGSAGQAVYDQQAQAAQQAQQQAVQATQQRSAVIGAPAALTAELTGSASEVANRYAQDATAAKDAYAHETERRTSANDDYYNKIRAAIPVMEAARRSKLAGTGSDDPLAKLVKSLGGIDLARPQLASIAQQAVDEAQSKNNVTTSDPKKYKGFGATLAVNPFQRTNVKTKNVPLSKKEKADLLDKLGAEAGLPAGVLNAFLGNKSPNAPTKKSQAHKNKDITNKIRTSGTYRTQFGHMSEAYTQLRDQGYSIAEAKQALRAKAIKQPGYAKNPDAFEQALKDLR